jgi:thiol:disulfide interchange protein
MQCGVELAKMRNSVLTGLLALMAVAVVGGCDTQLVTERREPPQSATVAGPLAPLATPPHAASPIVAQKTARSRYLPQTASYNQTASHNRSATKQPLARGSLRFVEGLYAGIEAASAQKKPMLVFFTASWCHFCHQMAADAFTDDQVVHLSERFVCVLVDADREPQACRQFQVRSYPTIQFISARGQPLNRVTGQRPGYEVLREMQIALQTLARAG